MRVFIHVITYLFLLFFLPTARSKNEPCAIVILRADRQRFAGSARLAHCFRMALFPGTD